MARAPLTVLEAPMSASDFGHDDDSASAGLRKGAPTAGDDVPCWR